MASGNRIWWLCIGVLVLVSLLTRLPAAWKLDVINDEMHHLQSWRNRYGTDDIYPLFLQRLEAGGRLSPQRLELVRRIYHLHPLVQRGLIVLVDPQPPVYPVLAELTQWATDSSLVLLRWWSVLFSLAAIYIAYRAGTDLGDPWTGLWLAILACVGATTQFYAGIGRPYALTQLTILLALWAFVRYTQDKLPFGRFLAWCLLAQAVQWMAWAVVGPLAAVAAFREFRASGLGIRAFSHAAFGCWWYILGSLLLALYMGVQLQNPTITQQGGGRSLAYVWWCFAVAGPFSHLGSFGDVALHAAAAAFWLAAAVGAVVLMRRARLLAAGIVLAALGGLAAAVLIGTEVRFAVSYVTPALVLAALGFTAAGSKVRCPWALPLAAMGFFGILATWHPEDPYQRIDQYDVPWSKVADALMRELKPGEKWITFPANVANNLYRYGPLPEPVIPTSERELALSLRDRSDACFLLEPHYLSQEGLDARVTMIAAIHSRFVIVRSRGSGFPSPAAADERH